MSSQHHWQLKVLYDFFLDHNLYKEEVQAVGVTVRPHRRNILFINKVNVVVLVPNICRWIIKVWFRNRRRPQQKAKHCGKGVTTQSLLAILETS